MNSVGGQNCFCLVDFFFDNCFSTVAYLRIFFKKFSNTFVPWHVSERCIITSAPIQPCSGFVTESDVWESRDAENCFSEWLAWSSGMLEEILKHRAFISSWKFRTLVCRATAAPHSLTAIRA